MEPTRINVKDRIRYKTKNNSGEVRTANVLWLIVHGIVRDSVTIAPPVESGRGIVVLTDDGHWTEGDHVIRVIKPPTSLPEKIEDVKPGTVLYVPTDAYLDHGEDDIAGGLATVAVVQHDPRYPGVNDYFVIVEEIPCRKYNLRGLLRDQEYLKQRHDDAWAHPDPDYSTSPEDRL